MATVGTKDKTDVADSNNQQNSKISFQPVLYNFRVTPNNDHKYALQLPFTVLFDNLISVIWLTYTKNPTATIGINQIQWALEFMKCMRVDNRYPESIGNIVKELEKRLIELYAKVGGKLHEIKKKQEEEEERELRTNDPEIEANELRQTDCKRLSYNEVDVMKILGTDNVSADTERSLRELNALGGRRPNLDELCNVKRETSKTLLIGALQNIKTKITDVTTKTEVEDLIKGLKIKNTPAM